MKTSKNSKIVLAAMFVATGISGQLLAQDTNIESMYQGDMKPGMRISTEARPRSELSDASRSGRSVVISGTPKQQRITSASSNRDVHVVKSGDTLWDICQTYYADPYVWPRVWSYNPSISNPHWIYPGDEVRLSHPGLDALSQSGPSATGDETVQRMSSRQLPDAILHRTRGYVDSAALEKAGTLSGSRNERMMLSQYDEAYVDFEKNRDVQVGDEFAVYNIIKEVEGEDDEEDAKLVEIIGSVRVTRFDKKSGVARVSIDESMGPIERGVAVGPVHRKFELVPSRTNQKEMKARVIAHLDPGILFTTHQIVFIDKGREQGVQEGNRFFAIRKRDMHRQMNKEDDANDAYPWEVIGELRVIETRSRTATCMVTGSIGEMEDGQLLEMVRGY